MWDAANTVGTDLRAGLIRQARGNVTGAQQGAPAPDAVIFEIVDEPEGISDRPDAEYAHEHVADGRHSQRGEGQPTSERGFAPGEMAVHTTRRGCGVASRTGYDSPPLEMTREQHDGQPNRQEHQRAVEHPHWEAEQLNHCIRDR